MKHRYRIFFLALLFCAFSSAASAIGHTVTINVTNNSFCFNSCNGSANAVVSGGVGPFAYAWTPSAAPVANVSGLCPGNYTVTVTDQSDMSIATATCVIVSPPMMSGTFSNVVNATCNMNNGSATFIAWGGVAPYTYNWVPCCGTSAQLSNASSGTYTIMVTDANGCTLSASVVIANATGPAISTVNVSAPTICAGQSTTLTPVFTGGTGPFTYSWSNPGNSLNNPTFPAPTASPTVTTTYTVTITDANGCADNSVVTVNVNPAVTGNITFTDPTCNQSNGSATVNITQAANPFSIAWSNGPSTAVNSNLPAGSYSVLVTDNNGCTLSLSQGLSNVGGPTVGTSATSAGCTNSSNGTATAIPSGIAPFTYLWSDGQTTATAVNLAGGNYMVTVTDAIGCATTVSTTVNTLSGNLYMYAAWGGPSNCGQPSGWTYSYVQGGTTPYSYAWSSGATTPGDTGLLGGSYSLTVTDANGCSSSGSVIVPSVCVNVVSGRVYYDFNNDGTFNSGDIPVAGTGILISPNNYYISTNASGEYYQTLPFSGTFDLSLVTLNPNFVITSPASGINQVNFASVGDTALDVDFVLMAPVQFQDLTLSLASGAARPGFTQTYAITCYNAGTTIESDTIWFRHDSILTLISSTPAFTNYTYPEGYWVYSGLVPGQYIYKTVVLQVPTIPNGGYIGRQLISNARIESTATDSTPTNNGDDEVDFITASLDPNAKECWSPTMNTSGEIWPSDLELDYTIHFQNCGNDTAFFIIVVDTLPAELDITTFEPGAASHPYTWSIDGHNDTNIVTFTFMNILLPDSNVNEAASHGFVQFEINRFPNLPIGTMIVNKADNYFDFNPPVPTNYNVVTISDPLVVSEPEMNNMVVYPNPAQYSVNIALASGMEGHNATITLCDITGRIVKTIQTNGAINIVIPTSDCAAGVYNVVVTCADRETLTEQLFIAK